MALTACAFCCHSTDGGVDIVLASSNQSVSWHNKCQVNHLSQTLLMQFLSVLSVIEGMYSFGRDVTCT